MAPPMRVTNTVLRGVAGRLLRKHGSHQTAKTDLSVVTPEKQRGADAQRNNEVQLHRGAGAVRAGNPHFDHCRRHTKENLCRDERKSGPRGQKSCLCRGKPSDREALRRDENQEQRANRIEASRRHLIKLRGEGRNHNRMKQNQKARDT